MSSPQQKTRVKRAALDDLVQVRVDKAMVIDFDHHLARMRKTRAEVLRELMQQWIRSQDLKRA